MFFSLACCWHSIVPAVGFALFLFVLQILEEARCGNESWVAVATVWVWMRHVAITVVVNSVRVPTRSCDRAS